MWSGRWVRAAALALGGLGFGSLAQAAEEALEPIRVSWPHHGIFGTYDRAAAQRGFQVYREVCAACHGLSLVAFRNLQDIGFNEEQVRAIAAEYEVPGEPDDFGEPTTRPALASDVFPPPYPNEAAARAANQGALPPDLALMTKAAEEGEDYVYSLLRGYVEPPPDAVPPREGLHFNAYFPGNWIAMPPPLFEGGITYADGTEASIPQMAHDVTVFLSWTAEPKLEERKQTGLKTMLFLIVLTGLLYATKRKIWADAH